LPTLAAAAWCLEFNGGLRRGEQYLPDPGHGKYLRAWSMKDGNLLWEVNTYTAAAPSADAAAEAEKDRGVDLLPLGADVDGDGAEDLLVLARGQAGV